MEKFHEVAYGTPMVWVFDGKKEILLDENGDVLNKYITKFVYHSKEEEDEECTIEFYIPEVGMLDLDYFNQDRVLFVQWGYITPYSTAIKSPIRKIAIRDIETQYDSNGIKVTLTCTDITSYLKSIANRKIAKYSKVDPHDSELLRLKTRELQTRIDLIEASAKGNFSVSEITNLNITHTGKDGRTYQAQLSYGKDGKPIYEPYVKGSDREYYKKPDSSYNNRARSKIDKTKNSRAEEAIKAHLDTLRYEESIKDKAKADEGKIIVDGTDDIITIKRRDFNQPIWRSFTYMSEPGIIKSFKPRTLTRLEKKDISATTSVNPYKKRVENTDLLSIDSKDLEKYIEGNSNGQLSTDTGDIIGKLNRKSLEIKEPTLKAYYKDMWESSDVSKYDPMTFSSRVPADSWSYDTPLISTEINEYGVPSLKPVEGRITIPTSKMFPSPYWNDFKKYSIETLKSRYGAATPKLTGYTIEKTIRKYEAVLEVLGDPSIVKGKVISLNGFSKKDSGKYYILKVRHEITVGSEYVTKIDLMQNPTTVGIKAKKEMVTLKVDKSDETNTFLEVIRDFEETDSISYEGSLEEEDIDNTPEIAYIGSAEEDLEGRINFLNAEEDFTMGKDLEGLSNRGLINEII